MFNLKFEKLNYKGLKYSRVKCTNYNFEIYDNLDEEELEQMKSALGTNRRPGKRKRIYQRLDFIKTHEIIGRDTIAWLKTEFSDEKRFAKLSAETQKKLNIIFGKLLAVEQTELEIEKEFADVSLLLKKHSQCSLNQVEEALFKLYEYLNLYYPLDDFKNNFLTLNKGRNIKEMLIYIDADAKTCIGIVIRSLRIINEKEIEKEIC